MARRIADELFGVRGAIDELPSYIDQNFRIREPNGRSWVLKISNDAEDPQNLDLQHRALERLAEREPGVAPLVRRSRDGLEIETVVAPDERAHLVRVLSYLDGRLLAGATPLGPSTWRSLGALLARVDRALCDLDHPAMRRSLRWNLACADWTIGRSELHPDPARRALVERAQLAYLAGVVPFLVDLPHGVIHNDGNDHNLVVDDAGDVVSLFDFDDMLHGPRVFELAVACAYAVQEEPDPVARIAAIVGAYDAVLPLSDLELDVLLPAIQGRLVLSITISALDAELDPDNAYIRVHQEPVWRVLEALDRLVPADVGSELRAACGRAPNDPSWLPRADVEELRTRHFGPSLSLSYERPLEIVRGRGAHFVDKDGRTYLDCVNNVCHVGHCHPHVVAAAQRQIAELNTNTRYLHDLAVRYAERLASLFPDPLEVVFFVNSGSEANELAIRLARTATGRRDLACVRFGYHGNTSNLVDLSSYKHDGPGGAGAPDWVHVAPCPDVYRGRYRADDPAAASKYAQGVAEAIEGAGDQGVAGFLAEPLIGCGGQIVPPNGWLREAFAHARAAGALCIADEVQVGFGRVGTHWWAFEEQGAVPDIVTLGKPIGNGHPMAAVVTTRAIAEAFATGMEYFSTFGGNPVSCAIGMAVLDVIEAEDLRANAVAVGREFLDGFRALAERYDAIGDVRGRGLYLGVELVSDRATREPDAERLAAAIEVARRTGILLSSDGPDHNVLKIKPPLCISAAEARLVIAAFDRALG